MAQLRPVIPAIRAAGAELCAVGSGKVHHLVWFMEDQKPDFPVRTDPTGAIYALAEMKRGKWSTVSPRAALSFGRAFAAGFRQEGIKGDPEQQGGVLIVRPGDELVWSYISQYAGDHPDPGAVLGGLGAA